MKKRYSKRTVLMLGKYLFQYKWLLLAAMVCTLGSNLFSLNGPRLTGYAIGAIEAGKGAVDFEKVFYYAGWMAVFYVVSAILSYGLQVLMITISPRLVLVFAFTVPLSVCLTKFITGKTRPLFRERSATLGELNGFVEEMITGQKTLSAYGREDYTIKRCDVKNKSAVDAYYRAEYYGSIVGPTVNFINNLSLSLISVFGALLYLAGSMTIGNISSFVLYSRKFSGPINEAANIMSELQSALAAAERVF